MQDDMGENRSEPSGVGRTGPALEHRHLKRRRSMSHRGQYTLRGVILKTKDIENARLGKPSPDFLMAILSYCPISGRMYWRERSAAMFPGDSKAADMRSRQWNTRYSGKETFTSRNTNGYAQAAIYDKQYLAHRVAWAIYYGEWPRSEIDHIDRVKDNNAINNLRTVTRSENLKNRVFKPKTDNWQSLGELARRLAEKAGGDA